MPDASHPYKPTRWQLFLECVQRELTYLPLSAAALLVTLAPHWEGTWLLAPLMVVGGGAHFIYDFLMGEEVREALQARMARHEEQAREQEIGELKSALPEGDARAIVAVRALEKALNDKIKENAKALELTGTFSHTYADMVKSVANSAIAALRRKRSLLETAEKLHELKADDDAQTLCAQIPELDNRIDQARETLQEALTQLTLMESEQDAAQVSTISSALCERLKVAEEIARDMAAAQAVDARGPEEPDDRRRERKKTR